MATNELPARQTPVFLLFFGQYCSTFQILSYLCAVLSRDGGIHQGTFYRKDATTSLSSPLNFATLVKGGNATQRASTSDVYSSPMFLSDRARHWYMHISQAWAFVVVYSLTGNAKAKGWVSDQTGSSRLFLCLILSTLIGGNKAEFGARRHRNLLSFFQDLKICEFSAA